MNFSKNVFCASSAIVLACQALAAACQGASTVDSPANMHSNVKLGRGLIRSCDKIVIYHALYGEVAFEGKRLSSLVERLEKCLRDEWWCDGFATKGREGWRVMIEFSVKSKNDPSKYDIIALFPLDSLVCKVGELESLKKLLKEAFPHKESSGVSPK